MAVLFFHLFILFFLPPFQTARSSGWSTPSLATSCLAIWHVSLSLQGSAVLFPFPLLALALILSLAFSIHLDLCLLPSHGPDKHNCQAFTAILFLCAQSKGRFQTSKQSLYKLVSFKRVLESWETVSACECLFSSVLSFKSYQTCGCLCLRRKHLY